MTNFIVLTTNEEKVLKEILDHRLDNGMSDGTYWSKKFEKVTGQDELTLRSTLGSLKEKEIINIPAWLDGVPYIVITNNTLEYFSEKERHEKEKKKEDSKSTRREIFIGIIGAIIGAIVTHITDIINWIKTLMNK